MTQNNDIRKLPVGGLPNDNELDQSIEQALNILFQSGISGLSRGNTTNVALDQSEKAREISRRVYTRMLDKIGLPTLGSYIRYQREREGVDQKTLAYKLEFPEQVLRELEQGLFEFFELPVQKAIGIAEIIHLNIQVVLGYLRIAIVQNERTTGLSYLNRPQGLRKVSPSGQANQDVDNHEIETFIADFVSALGRRGLIGK